MNMQPYLNIPNSENSEETGRTAQEKIEKTLTEELIIGVCSPIGSKREIVISSIQKRLEKDYKYEVEIIKLSDFITAYHSQQCEDEKGRTPRYTELMHKIKGGDFLRTNYSNGSILIELAIKKIREDREHIETTDIKGRRKCYIIDSLKNIEELKLLRGVYREIFYFFSIFSPEDERKEILINKGLSLHEVEELINTDEYENNIHGQNVRDTFIEGDFFIRISKGNENKIDKRIERCIHLIFNSEIITPDNSETAMYNAKSAAGNSACLSRQVGAAITDKDGISIASGWNDVPKFGGNLYGDSDLNSKRCKDLGYCSNVTTKNEIVDDIITKIESILYSEKNSNLKIIRNQSDAKIDEIRKIIQKSKVKNIIEYSRSIHAEMHAIIIGSQLTGSRMVGGSLFCTTYPCHNCARHIVLAGIKEIYYIEPYKKSLGIQLHNDSLTEDELDETKVRILPYDGVAPRRYLDFFLQNGNERKTNDGNVKKQKLDEALPKIRLSLQAIPVLENQAIHALNECGLINV